jgi:hypothetical protein
LSAFLLQTSCNCSRNPKDNKTKGAENKKIEIHIKRFEKDLFTIDLDSISKDITRLKKTYNEFFDLYSIKVIGIGSPKDKGYPELLKKFITDYYMNLNYARVKEVFPDISDLEKDFSAAFENYATYFPEKKIPQIYTCISGWNQSIFTSDSIIGIALDKYLGRNCEFYEKLGLDLYKRYTLQREYILPDALRTWGYTEFEFSDSANNVLGNMLYEGKILYFMKLLTPESPDSIIFSYTPDQLKWCKKNTSAMWTYLIEHKLLFSTDYLTIRKLVYPSPFTSFFTNESPGRAAVWLGYKIIETYMKNNQDVTLPDLMKNTNYQQILRDSKFNP